MNKIRSLAVAVAVAASVFACSSREPAPQHETLGATSQAATSVNVYHSTWNGSSAGGNAYAPGENARFDVWENKSNQGRSAYLSYFRNGVDMTSQVCVPETVCQWNPSTWQCDWETITYCYYSRYFWEQGWGEIPTRDFRVGGHTAHLATDLSKDPNFSATRCTFDYYNWTSSCGPAPGGTIDVTWRANGFQSSDSQGTSTSSYSWFNGSYTVKSVGHTSMDSADVSGSFLGVPASGISTIAQSRGGSVSRDIIKDTAPGGGHGGGNTDAGTDGSTSFDSGGGGGGGGGGIDASAD